jgi:hypothetical protein
MSGQKPTKFVFDWHAHGGAFLDWFLPTVLVGMSNEEMERLAEETKKFSKVHLQVLVNGNEVNAVHFLQSVERNMEDMTCREARRMLDDAGGLEALEERIGEIRSHLIEQVEAALRARGIELPARDEWGS